jgi:hypothetical protein
MGWTGEGRDGIIWNDTLKVTQSIFSPMIYGELNNSTHPHQDVKTTASPEFVDITTGTLSAGTSILGNTTIGTGAAGVDYTIDFNGESNDAQIKWDEDGNYFRVNKGWWHFVPAGYTTDFTRYYDSGSVLRSYLTQAGLQKWTMQTGGVEKGNLQYTMPRGNIGIAVFNATGTARSEINFVQTGGIQLRASTTSSAGNIGLELNVSDDVKILNNLYVGKNLYVGGCIKYNGGTLGSCI